MKISLTQMNMLGGNHSRRAGQPRPAFDKEGQVTAATSGINDGAALILSNADKVKNLEGPAGKDRYGFGGVAPRVMGMGPVPASKMALERASLKISQIDVASNEAFAAQGVRLQRARFAVRNCESKWRGTALDIQLARPARLS